MIRWIIAMIILVVAGGCGMPQTKIYSLSLPEAQQVQVKEKGPVLTIAVRAPRHLSQPYIASRTAPYQMEISRYAKWVASPEEMVREAFRDQLSASGLFREVHGGSHSAPDSYLLRIHVRRFEREALSEGQVADISLDYSFISPDGKELRRGLVKRRLPLSESGNVGLAGALSAGLNECIGEVRVAVEKALAGGK